MNFKRPLGGLPAALFLMVLAAGKMAAVEFDLIPKAFVANPVLDMSALTEMTDEGRKRPAASREHPVYFAAITRPMQETGRLYAGIQAPSPALVASAMQRALAANGFLPADQMHPPTLLIIYDWGIYNKPLAEIDPDGNPADNIGDISGSNLLNRAALVGGLDFAQKLKKALEQEYLLKLASADQSVHPAMNPVNTLRKQNPVIFDRMESELYFIVATAFDFASIERKQPVRLWRTKLTVDSGSVNLAQTLPALIASSAPYLGRDIPEAVTLRRRVREGRVELGPTIYLDDPVPPPPTEEK